MPQGTDPSNDLHAGPNVQIRDKTVLLPIPTLDNPGNFPVPTQVVAGLFELEWLHTDYAPKPLIRIKNQTVRDDLKQADKVTISLESFNEQFFGSRQEYVDIDIPLLVEIESIYGMDMLSAQQRTWNLFQELHRIWAKWMLALRPYHVLYFDGLTEDYEAGANHSRLEMRIRATAKALPVFVMRSGGFETPAVDPGTFPDGDQIGDL